MIDRVLADWVRPRPAAAVAGELLRAGVSAAALADAADLVTSEHLRERGFWEALGDGVVPGLPWRASFGRTSGPAPELGIDTEAVLGEVLGYSRDEVGELRRSGALG